MKKLFILAILLAYHNMAFADSDISAVFIKNDEVFISIEDAGEQIQLTHDGIPKGSPVWSKDGTMIAFMKLTQKNVALDSLVVIGRDGKPLYNFLIHPVHPDLEEVGMRYVERLEWVTNSKIAVAGTINPSTCETIVFDLSRLKISSNFGSDGYPTYSPNGLHVAYVTGKPHFTPKGGSEPELDVDNNRRIFPPRGTKVDFISDPAWSADSQALAIVAMYLSTDTSNIVIWHLGDAKPLLVPIQLEEEAASLFWNGDALMVKSGQHAWSFEDGMLRETSFSQAVNPKQEAIKIKKKLETSFGIGAGQSDFWCQSCPLSLLPRRSPIYDNDHDVK